MSTIAGRSSADTALSRFDSLDRSLIYAGGLDDTPTHRRELRCLRACLTAVPAGSRVLDLPCGAGRLLPFLTTRGYRVFAADTSQHMLDRAGELVDAQNLPTNTEFSVQNVLKTSFPDHSMDAVICNRLFHHFIESDTRIQALRELKRISRGPIIVSFFCSHSLGSRLFLLKNRLRRNPRTDRVPIPLSVMAAEVAAAGLKIVRSKAAKPLLGKQWYLELSA